MGGEVKYPVLNVPHIEDWVEPLIVAPALGLDVLDGSRIARHFQVFQVFQQGPLLFLVDPVAPEGPRALCTSQMILEGLRAIWT